MKLIVEVIFVKQLTINKITKTFLFKQIHPIQLVADPGFPRGR